jgi:hypothetical protein
MLGRDPGGRLSALHWTVAASGVKKNRVCRAKIKGRSRAIDEQRVRRNKVR